MSRSRFWPNPVQYQLLSTCLLRDKSAAVAAWRGWKSRIDLDDLDFASFRIMSLVYRRLLELEIQDVDMGRIKGIYRFQWTKNKLAFRGKADLLQAFAAAGIETMLLKGAALSQMVYSDPSARTMHDLDFLVHLFDARKAMDLLRARGWVPQHFDPEAAIEYLHACSFLHPEFGEVDLHWHIMRSRCQVDRDERLWAAAIDCKFEDAPTKVLCPADLFLHACEHSLHNSSSSSLQWIVDACFILRHSRQPMDWNRLVEQTKRFRLTLPVRETLSYLHRHFDENIPEDVTVALANIPVPIADRIEFFLAGRPEKKQSDFVQKQGLALCHYLKLNEGRSLLEIVQKFPVYIRLSNHYRRGLGVVFWEFLVSLPVGLKRSLRTRAFRLHNLLRGKPTLPADSIARIEERYLKGFFPLEFAQASRFRWTSLEASIRLDIPAGSYDVLLEFLSIFPQEDLPARQLVFKINNQIIPATDISLKLGTFLNHGLIRIKLNGDHQYTEGNQILSCLIQGWTPSNGDSRSLGIPIASIWVLASNSTANR